MTQHGSRQRTKDPVHTVATQRIVDEKIEDPGHTPADLLAKAQQLQQAFWDAIAELEAATGTDLDTTNNLSDYDLDNLYLAAE